MVIEPWKYGSKIKIKLGNQITKLQLPKKKESKISGPKKLGIMVYWWIIWMNDGACSWVLSDSTVIFDGLGLRWILNGDGPRVLKKGWESRKIEHWQFLLGNVSEKQTKNINKKRLETSSKLQKVFDDSTNPATYIRYFNISITPWVW